MKFSEMNHGHVTALREIIELLLSAPPETTVEQLIGRLVFETIYGEYKKTESGRHRNNKRLWIYEVLMGMPNLPEEVIRKGVDRILEKQFQGYPGDNMVNWAAKIWFIPNLPADLKEKFYKLNHQDFAATQRLKKILNSFFPLWLASSETGGMGFVQEGQVLLFANSERWEILDENENGVLLYRRDYSFDAKVVLLPDVSGQSHGYAHEVDTMGINTVHEARAWMFRQNPQKWRGFDKEV
ncbi:MAG: hypothetical protein WC514_01515 [Candidatus Paceibacterota bacterium]